MDVRVMFHPSITKRAVEAALDFEQAMGKARAIIEGGGMIPAQALRSPVADALDAMAAGRELDEQQQAIVRDLDGATPEEVREALDAEGTKRHPAFMVKMRSPFGPWDD